MDAPMPGLLLFLNAVLVGVVVAAPPGPAGALTIGRTLRRGLAPGLASALGAVLADGLWGAVAAVGAGAFAAAVVGAQHTLSVVAAPALAALGTILLVRARRRAARPEAEARPAAERPLRTAGTSFLLSLGSAGTLPALLALLAGLGLGSAASTRWAPLLVAGGVFAGAALWWTVLCLAVHRYRRLALRHVHLLDYAAALLLLVGAAAAAARAVGA